MSKCESEEKLFIKASNEYEYSLDEDFKKNNGIFYTDMELANAIMKFLNVPSNATVIDPSCGSGSFIKAFSNVGIKNIVGCDFDIQTVEKCKELCGIDTIYQIDTLGLEGNEVLKSIQKERFDYVIGNPPYAPLNGNAELDTSAGFLNLVRTSGNNLFIAALYRAFELAKEDGYISFIIPKNLLHIASYKDIRKSILENKSIVSIIELGIHFKTVRGEQIVLTMQNKPKKNNKIKFYEYTKGKISFLSEVKQQYYQDEVLVFTSNDEVGLYDKLSSEYSTLGDMGYYIRRGHNKSKDAIRGKQVRKFGFKECEIPTLTSGANIFIQNIFSAEAGITACFAGDLYPNETVTMITTNSLEDSKYLLGILHSRVFNYYLIRFAFNNSRLTIHTDAKYLNKIPVVMDQTRKEKLISLVNKLELVPYMEEEWFKAYERLNLLVYEIYGLKEDEISYIEKEMRKISASKWYGKMGA